MDENSLPSINLRTEQHHTVSPTTSRTLEQFLTTTITCCSQPPSVEVIKISELVNEAGDDNSEIKIVKEVFRTFDGIEIKKEPIDDEISFNNLMPENSGNNLSYQSITSQNTSVSETQSTNSSKENCSGTSIFSRKYKKKIHLFGKTQESSFGEQQESVDQAEISNSIGNSCLTILTPPNGADEGEARNLSSQDKDTTIIDLTEVSSNNSTRTIDSASQSVIECVDHIEEVVRDQSAINPGIQSANDASTSNDLSSMTVYEQYINECEDHIELLRKLGETRNPHSTNISVKFPSGAQKELSLLSTIPRLSQIFATKYEQRPCLRNCDSYQNSSRDIDSSNSNNISNNSSQNDERTFVRRNSMRKARTVSERDSNSRYENEISESTVPDKVVTIESNHLRGSKSANTTHQISQKTAKRKLENSKRSDPSRVEACNQSAKPPIVENDLLKKSQRKNASP